VKKKPTKKKSSKPSTTRSTAGSGFDFEDLVAAWLLLKALSGQPIPGVEGVATCLQMQTEAIGWAIDDILSTTEVSPDDRRHLAISCKSNVQVTRRGLPSDFVKLCWQQWTKADPNPMQRGKDCLMLATRGRNDAFMATWTDLKTAAKGKEIKLAIGRMSATANHRKIFESVKAPARDADVMVSDSDVVAMVNSIEVAPVDFQVSNSEDEKLAVREARALLVNGSPAEGRRLWAELIDQARNTRLGSGTMDIADLWRQLRVKFALKDHPDYEASWQRLKELTVDYKATIETALPSGLTLQRKDETDDLVARIATDPVCVVFGESGSGKSALVKTTLDERFSSAAQVWLEPDVLGFTLNEAMRTSLGIDHPLVDVLDAAANSENFLVIDAAERLDQGCAIKTKALIEELRKRNALGAKSGWHVLIVGQTEALVSGALRDLVGTSSTKTVEVAELAEAAVRDVLRKIGGLAWLATHDDAVSALSNLRTLAWVIQAAARFQGEDGSGALSLPAIADRLWLEWTDRKPSVQRLLMKLAEREAAFEHTFAISQLESGDAAALDDLPTACPLRRDASGRIKFQHDLAADWARFQRLREIAQDTLQWARYAGNPFWHGALRMLGQFLLRQQVGTGNAWDVAFDVAEVNRQTTPLADDILLDALFLDPNAEAFLDGRADRLLENSGARLLRLVRRFEHVASVPGASPLPSASGEIFKWFRDLSLYIEAHFRIPIFGRWPAMARFTAKHRDRIAKLASPAIASLCDRWLSSTPPLLPNGSVTPFRREFAELALASARELQLILAKGIISLVEGDSRIYQAVFSAAPDLPADVCDWALEMAQRRPYRADIIEQVRAHRRELERERRERLATDAEYRKSQERVERMSTSSFPVTRLPPWPLGARAPVEGRFREAVLRSPGFYSLMRTNAAVAGEVLLACIIEDEPKEEYRSRIDLEHELGIEFDSEGYPTAPWKSPFYAFLQIDPDAALKDLHRLVNFATERWVQAVREDSGSDPVPLSLLLDDGTVRTYAGNYWVFGWSHEDSNFAGQLHCALAALEQWLCNLIDGRIDVAPLVDGLLRATNSVAVLGVLVNAGKCCEDLFKGPLRSLLGVRQIYAWDSWRRERDEYASAAMLSWAGRGEVVFEIAKNWVFAPYRKKQLREIVPKMVVDDRAMGDFVVAAASQWTSPETEKEALEFRILVAQLDYRNYSSEVDTATGKQVPAFVYPHDLAEAIAVFQQDRSLSLEPLKFPQTCRNFLLGETRMLHQREAEWVASLMAAADGDGKIELEEDMIRAPRVAAAALLLLRAPDWLAENTAVQQRAQSIIDAAIADISNETPSPHFQMAPSHLEFAAYFAAERWIAESSKLNDENLLRLLTSGDNRAVQVLVWAAYGSRAVLEQRWWRLLYLALLWSGLSMLRPAGYRDDDSDRLRWQRWCRWLRTRSLSAENMTIAAINPLDIAERVEPLEFKQRQRRYAKVGMRFTKEQGGRLSGGLDTHFLQNAFAWLFRSQVDRVIPTLPKDELETRQQLVRAFWAHQVWWLIGSRKDDNDDYQPMYEFGYAILEELARLIVDSPPVVAPSLWRPVFALGPKGHYAIGHFLRCWFFQITETTLVAEFAQRWRPMIEFMLSDEEWAEGGPWFYGEQLERQVLGFGASDYLVRIPDHVTLIGMIRDLLEVWAKKRLTGDEDNLAGFCEFIAAKIGAPLRIDALQWIADAMRAHPKVGKWFRDRTSNAFMEFLDVVVSEHAAALSKDDKSRRALLDLAAHAVSRQLTAALALQERIRRAF
jgi:hypothetical protein